MKKAGLFIITLGIGLIIFATFVSFTVDKTAVIHHSPPHLFWYPLAGMAVMGVGALILHRSS